MIKIANTTERDEVSALARGLALLEAVAAASAPVAHRDLVERTKLPKATVTRLLATLQARDYLRQSEGSEAFRLGPKALHLGSAYLRQFDFREVARLHLAALAEDAAANVHIGIRHETDILVIDTLRPRAALILSRMDIGSRMAIATSASGRAYLASLDSSGRSALMADIQRADPKGWAHTRERLEEALKEHERLGFCSSFGEWHPDIHALGFVLRSPQGETFAISVGGPAFKLSKEWLLNHVAPRILDITHKSVI